MKYVENISTYTVPELKRLELNLNQEISFSITWYLAIKLKNSLVTSLINNLSRSLNTENIYSLNKSKFTIIYEKMREQLC